ncbi:hypothetical protein Pelo_8932 [Pelomyxa schiedti]|nr:hypothetical protein Pelo_8932 [Pelomyxa schiedti]
MQSHPAVWSPPRVALDVVVSAVDQFITFACGALIARTRALSPARLLIASPSIIEQLGREWVVCCCREVVFTVSGGIKGGTARDLDHEAHVWMRLSPTLGVVRSGVFETFGESDGDNRLAIKTGDCCLVQIQPTLPVYLEPFKDCPPLGRFVMQDGHLTIGVGIVKSVEPPAVTAPAVRTSTTTRHLKPTPMNPLSKAPPPARGRGGRGGKR